LSWRIASDTVNVFRLASHATLPENRAEVVEGLGWADHKPRNAFVAAGVGEEQRPAPVGDHQRDVVKIQRVQKIGDDVDHPGHGQVRLLAHRDAVPAHGQHRQQIAESRREHRQRQVPLGVVHEQTMQQHDRRTARVALLPVFDGSGGYGDGFHGDPSAIER
jgi:hypothetical protein